MTLAETNPVVEIMLGTLALIGIIVVHGAALRATARGFNKSWVRVNALTPGWRISMILTMTIGAMTATHLLETLLWALPIYGLAMLSTLRDSYFFVLGAYTTLGSVDVALPDQWRLIGPMIAMSGIFTFGWTGSVLVTIMNELSRLDRTQASKGQRESAHQDGT